jgi:hypothetical protein
MFSKIGRFWEAVPDAKNVNCGSTEAIGSGVGSVVDEHPVSKKPTIKAIAIGFLTIMRFI